MLNQPNRDDLSLCTKRQNDLYCNLQNDEYDGDETAGAADTSAASFDRARLARLLDDLSDENEEQQGDEQGEDLSLGVEEVLLMAWTERREKQEAKKVLSQLQQNYDVLQRKFADAENRIDKLR